MAYISQKMFYFCILKFDNVLENIGNFLLTTDIYSWKMISVLVLTGILVGFVNTLAGMATALSYVLFMAMGMPINVANGTSRVGVLAQFAVSSALFKKHGYLDIKLGAKVGIPIAIGSVIGAQGAAVINPAIMEVAMGLMLPVMAFLLIYNQRKKRQLKSKNILSQLENEIENKSKQKIGVLKFIAFVLIGVYGGFTHAGVGILILFGSFYLLGLDLIKSNGIKQFAVLIYTPLALVVFIWHGQINWPVALIYGVGNVTGAVIASQIAVKWGTTIINYVIAVAVLLMSFWLIYKQFI